MQNVITNIKALTVNLGDIIMTLKEKKLNELYNLLQTANIYRINNERLYFLEKFYIARDRIDEYELELDEELEELYDLLEFYYFNLVAEIKMKLK